MKALAILAIMFLPLAVSVPQAKQEDLGLPELHMIKSATLGPAYSCRSKEDFNKGYENTALFLSANSWRQNGPELLFNGSCGSEDYLESVADVGMIADLGEIPLEKMSAQLIFNTRRVHSFDLYSKFTKVAKVQLNHTYAVLISRSTVRSMFIFTVTGYVPNKRLDLRYVVKEYQVLQLKAQSPGFSWDMENIAECSEKQASQTSDDFGPW